MTASTDFRRPRLSRETIGWLRAGEKLVRQIASDFEGDIDPEPLKDLAVALATVVDEWDAVEEASVILELEPAEVAMLGHALRMVPDHAVLTGKSLVTIWPEGGKGVGFFHDIPAFVSLWNTVARAVKERDEMAPFRGEAS